MHNTNPIRLLLVDDQREWLMLMKQWLKNFGFASEICVNGENLIQLINDNAPQIILIDVRMAGINGGELCRRIKREFHDQRIHILLHSADRRIEEIAREYGADGFIPKSASLEEFLVTLRSFVN